MHTHFLTHVLLFFAYQGVELPSTMPLFSTTKKQVMKTPIFTYIKLCCIALQCQESEIIDEISAKTGLSIEQVKALQDESTACDNLSVRQAESLIEYFNRLLLIDLNMQVQCHNAEGWLIPSSTGFTLEHLRWIDGYTILQTNLNKRNKRNKNKGSQQTGKS